MDKFISDYHDSEGQRGENISSSTTAETLSIVLSKAPIPTDVLCWLPELTLSLYLTFLSKEFVFRRFYYCQGWDIKGKLRWGC